MRFSRTGSMARESVGEWVGGRSDGLKGCWWGVCLGAMTWRTVDQGSCLDQWHGGLSIRSLGRAYVPGNYWRGVWVWPMVRRVVGEGVW